MWWRVAQELKMSDKTEHTQPFTDQELVEAVELIHEIMSVGYSDKYSEWSPFYREYGGRLDKLRAGLFREMAKRCA